MAEQPSKLAFKHQCKSAIQKTWTNILVAESVKKSTLKYINTKDLAVGKPHIIWKSLRSMVSEVKMGITKARMLTGTFMTQVIKHKYNIEHSDQICKLCTIYSEDLMHIILDCPALFSTRQIYYNRLKIEVINVIGESKWSELFGNKDAILLLILDCSNFSKYFSVDQQNAITKLSSVLCHQLYLMRLKLLEKTAKVPNKQCGSDTCK
ncbi:Hypothetical predicted protein [Mytilus galloprovincialis]|uniref:Reverse transcriptase zinc-binding domain-containing protein n=1 Tax=Mytilus galloprovincialis TaxID=29158 RepID=A0A8B6FLV2_MYTGA|nr:Hypothetical predicted protein [Mytilus galloprovincialis]